MCSLMHRSRFLLRTVYRQQSYVQRPLAASDVFSTSALPPQSPPPPLLCERRFPWRSLNASHGSTWPCMTLRSLECSKLHRRKFLSFGDGDEDPGLSKKHEETRLVRYSPEQLFSVVAAVDLYQDFVPWCQRSTVLWQEGDIALEAELEIGFKFLVEKYISHVELKRPTLIKTSVSQSNLFEYLINIWEFKPGPTPDTCNLHFKVSFQFRSPLYRQVSNMFFEEVVSRLVGSFEQRCNAVYGPRAKVLNTAQTA